MKRLPVKRALLVLLAGPLLAAASGASVPAPKADEVEAYTIDWWTVDDGGGSSSGGSYALSGTIAQPDADPLAPSSGGAYELGGGYWGAGAQANVLFEDGFE